MVLWSLWKNRNSKLWENSDSAPTFIVQSAKNSLNEWRYMQHHKNQGQIVHHTVLWTKPPPPFLKCNAIARYSTTTRWQVMGCASVTQHAIL